MLLAFGQWPSLASAAAPPANLSTSAVTLGWDPSPDPNATGYSLLFGTTSGVSTNQLAVGNTNRATVTGLIPNVVYYFSVVAYDASGQQSLPSNEVSYSPPSAVISLLVTNVLLSADRHGRALMPDITGTNFALAINTCTNSGVLTQSVAAGAVLALGTNRVVLTLIDGCGNVACATNFVIVEDTTPPVLEGLPPAAVNYQYRQDVPPVPTVTAMDNCDGPMAVNYLQSESNPGVLCSNKITRTWTAADKSGNTTHFAQTITVISSTPLVLSKGTISPWYPTQAAAEAAALAATGMSDNCTQAGQLTANVTTLGSSNATITVTAIDGCGNTASVSYDTHIDNTPPTIQILTQAGGVLTLTWGAIAGQKFQVQYQTNWFQTGWINLGDPIPATNATMTASDTIGPDPQRFYRVLIVP